MTREMAIEELQRHRKEFAHDHGWSGSVLDALDVAIEALQTEPCEDCISRQAAVSVANDFDATQVVRGLEKLPSVKPKQKMGKWIYEPRRRMIDETDDGVVYREEMWCKCSECGADFGYIKNKDKYCKFCGAKMEEVK